MGVPSPPFWTIVINTFGKNNLSKINSYFYSFQFFGEMIIPLIFAFIISNFSSNHFISFACFIILIATFLIYYFPEDKQLKNQIEKIGLKIKTLPTIMSNLQTKRNLARQTLEFSDSLK